MAWFRWMSSGPLPAAWDLRRCGWKEAAPGRDADSLIALLIDGGTIDAAPEQLPPEQRARTIVLGLAGSTARARWLAMGYADALAVDLEIEELGQRAGRAIASRPGAAFRHIGRLTLDLLTRDARFDGARLRLHPREFALLWRLADVPGALVRRAELLGDVFELSFDPGTNRLAVHVCRLRKKLALVGLTNLLATAPGESAYRLVVNANDSEAHDERGGPPRRLPSDAQFMFGPQFPLDPAVRLGEHTRPFEELVR